MDGVTVHRIAQDVLPMPVTQAHYEPHHGHHRRCACVVRPRAVPLGEESGQGVRNLEDHFSITKFGVDLRVCLLGTTPSPAYMRRPGETVVTLPILMGDTCSLGLESQILES
jgi:hypothetical protein